jgi:regulator of replication initiation timing
MIRGNETKIKEFEYQIEVVRKEIETISYSNDTFIDRNHELKIELDSLNQLVELLIS